MDPISATLMALGTGANVAGKLFEGYGASEAGKLQSQIAAQNAELYRMAADAERGNIPVAYAKAAVEEGRVRDRLARVLAGQTAHFASGNLDPTYGSPLLMQGYSAAQGEADAGLVRAAAALEDAKIRGRALALEQKGTGSAIDAITARQKAEQARIAGYFGAGTAALQGGAQTWRAFGTPPASPGGYAASSITAGGDPFAYSGSLY